MSRDQRAEDNWALLYAQEKMLACRQPLIVVFNLVPFFYLLQNSGVFQSVSIRTVCDDSSRMERVAGNGASDFYLPQ
jgi:hypothetical protein